MIRSPVQLIDMGMNSNKKGIYSPPYWGIHTVEVTAYCNKSHFTADNVSRYRVVWIND